MSFAQCMSEAVNGGEIDPADADFLKSEYDRLRAKFAKSSEATADLEAKRALLAEINVQNALKRRRARLAVRAIKRVNNDLNNHRLASGANDVASGALAMLEHFGSARFDSVAGRERAIIGLAHARLGDMLSHFRRGAVLGDRGRHNVADLDDVLLELFGEESGNKAAAEFAEAWSDVSDGLRQRFNAAGGDIGHLKDWGLPQRHDAVALRAAGLEKWKAEIAPRLNLDKMRHPRSGEPVSADELDDILDEVFDSIVTDGWNKREPQRQPFGRGSLASQRSQHRFLVFNSAEDWKSYQQDFGGGGDVFALMMDHVKGMARDIAPMEVLGPNPDGTIEWLKQRVQKEAALKTAGKDAKFSGKPEKAVQRANQFNHRIDAVWASYRGALETPVHGTAAKWLAGGRNFITASVLGSAAISSISDIGTSMIARQFAGLSRTGSLGDMLKALKPSTRREAVAAGLILDSALNVFHNQARYVDTLTGPEWTTYIADRVLTYSGLLPWTQAGRHAFGLAFMETLASHAGKGLDDLPPALQRSFARYGVTGDMWELIRRIKPHTMANGVKIIRPPDVGRQLAHNEAEKLLHMIQAETEFAIPSGSHRSRTVFLDQNQPGTLIGEIVRSFAQFKSFGAVFMLLHGGRMHQQFTGGHKARGALYAGSLLASTTILGALALQAKQTAAGRDPRDISSEKFWGAALLQGGGLGIYGDFLFSDLNRYGGGFSTTIGGPVVERANNLWNLTGGNLVQAATGEKTNFGRELTRFFRSNVPGGNIWYTRLAWERLVMDRFQELVDPEAKKAFRRKEQFWKREFNQDYFWAPGDAAPERLPGVAN